MRVRLDNRVLVGRRGRAREGRLWVKLGGSVLIEALELVVLVTVESILSKRCVSLLAASNVGCAAMRARKRATLCMCVYVCVWACTGGRVCVYVCV